MKITDRMIRIAKEALQKMGGRINECMDND